MKVATAIETICKIAINNDRENHVKIIRVCLFVKRAYLDDKLCFDSWQPCNVNLRQPVCSERRIGFLPLSFNKKRLTFKGFDCFITIYYKLLVTLRIKLRESNIVIVAPSSIIFFMIYNLPELPTDLIKRVFLIKLNIFFDRCLSR